MNFSYKNRKEMISALKSVTFDVLVIGGGITGVGIALDTSARGMKTALVEMQDFSAGTSSRSTKLIHGGLRYLKQFEVKMVAEVGKERAIVYENGPHVTTPEWMLLPLYKGGTFGKYSTSFGLRLYDFLAGVKKSERRKMLTSKESLEKEPLIKKEGIKGAGYYVEYRTDDSRLTIEVAKAAFKKGATLLNYCKVEKLLYDNGKVTGALVKDQLNGEFYKVRALKVVNATGPWVDFIREKDQSKQGKFLKLTKGVHIVLDERKFPLKQAVYFDTPDGRMVFAIPRDGKTYVGTTDTFYKENPIKPRMTLSDRSYLIEAINYMFPDLHITDQDVESSWAGLRPLIAEEGKHPSEISRKDEVWESKTGLITIAGGKLTGYRKMAEMVGDFLSKRFKQEYSRVFLTCQTENLPISGGEVGGSKKYYKYIAQQVRKGISMGLDSKVAKELVSTYGSNSDILLSFIKDYKRNDKTKELSVALYAKLLYALEHEMCVTPLDFFNRRTGALLFHIDYVRKNKIKVIEFMSSYFNWDYATKIKYAEELDQALVDATIPADETLSNKT